MGITVMLSNTNLLQVQLLSPGIHKNNFSHFNLQEDLQAQCSEIY